MSPFAGWRLFTFLKHLKGFTRTEVPSCSRPTLKRGSNTLHCVSISTQWARRSPVWGVCVIYCCAAEQCGFVSQFSWDQLNSSVMCWAGLQADRRGSVSCTLLRYDAGQSQDLDPDCIDRIYERSQTQSLVLPALFVVSPWRTRVFWI